jgi:hypothetical protein
LCTSCFFKFYHAATPIATGTVFGGKVTGYVNLDLDENSNPKVRLTWGGPFAHWGVEIGMQNMKIPPSNFSQWGEYRLPLEPGVYVWHEIQ